MENYGTVCRKNYGGKNEWNIFWTIYNLRTTKANMSRKNMGGKAHGKNTESIVPHHWMTKQIKDNWVIKQPCNILYPYNFKNRRSAGANFALLLNMWVFKHFT